MLEDDDPQHEDDEPDGIFGADPFELAHELLNQASADPIRPDDFDGYRFLGTRPLGEGSMGEVWLAQDAEVARPVAIKLLRNVSDSKQWAEREIKRLGALEFRYIARLYDHGLLPDKTPWLELEYVDGKPLDDYCRHRRCSLTERLALFHAVCEGVQYAHSRGIIHGDLKPSNILVKQDGEPKLLDFGVAEQFRSPDGATTESPSPRGFTPAYAAPEQISGAPVSISVDVYALGVILYELLTGSLPFEGSRYTALEMGETKDAAVGPVPPSVTAARSSASAKEPVPGLKIKTADWADLDSICLKALSPDLNRRYSSVESLLREIDCFLSCRPVNARSGGWLYRSVKFVNRNRRAAVALAATLALIAGLIGYYTLQLRSERNVAVAETQRTQEVQQFFLYAFDHAGQTALPVEKSRIVRLFLDGAARDAASLHRDPIIQADIYQGLGTMYQQWGELTSAERLLRQSLAIKEANFPKESLPVLKVKLALGAALQERGMYDEAIAAANEALRFPLPETEYRAALSLLADAHFHLGQLNQANSLYEKVLAIDNRREAQNQPDIADDLMNLGNLQLDWGHYPESETLFRQALSLNESRFGKDSPQAADSASYVAQAIYFQGGREDEETRLLRHALASLEKSFGEMDTRVAFTIAQLGDVATERKHLDEAEADYKQSAAIYRAVRGDDHQSVAIELANAASTELEKNDYVRAELGFRDVIRRLEKILPPDNGNLAVARIKLGHCLLGQKRYSEAEPELRKGYDVLVKQTAASVTWLVKARKDLVIVYTALNQPEKAVQYREESALVKTQ